MCLAEERFEHLLQRFDFQQERIVAEGAVEFHERDVAFAFDQRPHDFLDRKSVV